MDQRILDSIPRHLCSDGTAETIELDHGYTAAIKLEHDSDHDAPWDACDGYGLVSDWRSKESKLPGERVLHLDGSHARFYDFAEAVKIARRDSWGSKGDEGLSKGAKAARAAEKDFEYLRAWCNDEWHYIGVCIEVTAPDGTQADASLWGVEDLGDYWREVAAELITECLADIAAKQHADAVKRCFV